MQALAACRGTQGQLSLLMAGSALASTPSALKGYATPLAGGVSLLIQARAFACRRTHAPFTLGGSGVMVLVLVLLCCYYYYYCYYYYCSRIPS